jgi:hypothetical protein
MEKDLQLDIIIECPNCKQPILIEKLNCFIFRHGILKSNGQQIDSHSSKELCTFYIKKDLIFGCGKPFQIVKNNNELVAILCDYI